jgi:hypothetical protein
MPQDITQRTCKFALEVMRRHSWQAIAEVRKDGVNGLVDEAGQLKKILGSIMSKTRGKSKR